MSLTGVERFDRLKGDEKMRHRNNWLSMMAGHPVNPPPMTSVDQIVVARGRSDTSGLKKDVPESLQVHENVVHPF